MSTPTMPTTKVLPPSRADREADADLLVDIPQLSADELALEVESTPELSRVKVDAKGLQSGVFVRADLEPVLRIMHERSQRQGGGRRA